MPELEVEQVKVFPEFAGGFIFNSSKFISLKSGNHLLFVLNSSDNPVARIWFKVEGKRAVSGAGATFGSVDSSRSLSEEEIRFFLEETIGLLRKQGLTTIVIKHWPESYDTQNYAANIYKRVGFIKQITETDQSLVVDSLGFSDKIKSGEKQKLKRSIRKGYVFKKLDSVYFDKVYKLITDTLNRKNIQISMNKPELAEALLSMRDKYLLFGVLDGKKIIAASVSIRISPSILYNFYHADDFNYRSDSPMVMLIGKIYEYCYAHGITIFNLGISSENGKLNVGLYNFKKNLGCRESEKNTYILSNE